MVKGHASKRPPICYLYRTAPAVQLAVAGQTFTFGITANAPTHSLIFSFDYINKVVESHKLLDSYHVQ
jgi:hypothetical protein